MASQLGTTASSGVRLRSAQRRADQASSPPLPRGAGYVNRASHLRQRPRVDGTLIEMSFWNKPSQVVIEFSDTARVGLSKEGLMERYTSSLGGRGCHPRITLSPLSPSKLLAGGEGPGVRGNSPVEIETPDDDPFTSNKTIFARPRCDRVCPRPTCWR